MSLLSSPAAGLWVKAHALPLEVAAVAIIMASCAGAGWKAHDLIVYRPHLAADAKAALKGEQDARKAEGVGQGIAQAEAQAHDTRKAATQATTKTIIERIPYYVPAPVSGSPRAPGGQQVSQGGGVRLSVGLGRVLDYAALGVNPPVPSPSREYLDADSGLGLPALAGSVASNYGVCREWRSEVEAWRGWYDREAKAWPVK